MLLITQLFLAHIIGDFYFQPDRWIDDKKAKKWASIYLYLHALIHFLLAWLFSFDVYAWPIALIIAITHLIIDGLKLQFTIEENKNKLFFYDQLMHVTVIFMTGLLWLWSKGDNSMLFKYTASFAGFKLLYLAGVGVIFLIMPASYIIQNAVEPFNIAVDNKEKAGQKPDTLPKAGQVIGILERLMIFVFILIGQWQAVGFLLAAKSIFRFGDLTNPQQRQMTEYVLIGTMLSFGLSIITGLAVTYLNAHF
jgi:hypothetical protein